jgi:hypothetical protein
MDYTEIQEELFKFNSDQDTQAIREYYSKKTFLEILSRSRSETTHSAFLSWLLKGDGFGRQEDAPLMRFLDVLVKNSNMIESPIGKNDEIKAAILSRTLEYTDVKTITEQTVKEISQIPSKDRLDIYLTASLVKPINNKHNLRIVIENKVFSDEIRVDNGKMDELAKVEIDKSIREEYLKLNQTQRYYKAVMEYPQDSDYNNDTITVFVFLSPDRNRPTDEHFIPISYQDLMDYVLEPISGNQNLDNKAQLYLQEYINALSVPSISDDNNEMTVLAVSNKEKGRLEVFWRKYNSLITAAAESNKNTANLNSSGTRVLRKFYEKNQPLFIAIYHIMPDKAEVLKPFTTRDYTKYRLLFNGQTIGENLGKRALVFAAFKTMKDNNILVPEIDGYNRVFFYKKDDFEKKHNMNELSDDTFNNRYTIIKTNDGDYAVCNQWGVGNWDWVEDILLKNDNRFRIEVV